MSFTVETITYGNDKHCFISLSAGSKFQQNKEVNLFELDVDGRKVYVSWSGEYIRSEDGTLQISRHFAEKLGIKENHEVTMKPLSSAPQCMKAVVEPVSADDWEILDRHTNRMVTDLQNQVRVVQPGVIYPFWVNKSTSVFIKVVSIEPDTEYAILVNETEVHLAPKVRTAEQERGGSIGQEVHEQQMKQSVTDLQNAPFIKDSLLTDEDGYSSRFTSVDSAESDYMSGFHKKKTKQDKTSLPVSSISNQWHAIRGVFFSYLGFKANSKTVNSDSEEDDLDESDHFTLNNQTITSGLNMVLRVQHLLYTPFDHDTQYLETIVRRGSSSPRKNGSVSPRKSPSKFGKSSSLPKSGFRHNFFPQQPSTIYMDLSDAEKQLECSRSEIPFEFFAKLRKLQSPKDQQQEKQQPPVASTAGKQGKGKNEKNGNGHDNGHSASCTETECNSEEGSLCVVVRVLVIDRRRSTCSEQYSAIVKRILEEQSLLEGHVIIPDMLRRTLKLDVTSRVWIQTFKGQPAQANGFVLHPLGNVNKRVTSDVLVLGFRQWLDQVSHEDYPMVIFQGFFVRFPVLPDEHVEVQITYNEVNKSGRGCYALLHPGVLRNTSLTVISGRSTDAAHPAIQPMLAYTSLSSIDPIVSKHRLEELGGLSELIEAALLDIETCLGSRPMYKEAFQTTPGLLNGMLLLTGPKGSGKTTFAKALCNRVAQLPNLAYTMIVDCKPLRGKKMDTIMRTFELVFDEAAWRQPTLIVLDDLDHIAGAPAGPEFELSSEALYAARVAEVVKDLLRKDIRNLTNIAVLASSVSRSSLHPILVSSRGTHLVQEVLAIKPPNLESTA